MTYSEEIIQSEIEWQLAHEGDIASAETSRRLAYRVLTVLNIDLNLGIIDDLEERINVLVPNVDYDEDGFAEDPDYDPNFDRYGVRVPEHPPLSRELEEELSVMYPDINEHA